MLVENQLIEVRINPKTITHYKNLGYNVKIGDIVYVPPQHLTKGSHVRVQVICDICYKPFYPEYKSYLRSHTYDMDCCQECLHTKVKKVNLIKYGVENVFSLPETQEKCVQTWIEKYGYDRPIKSDEVKEKFKLNFISKHGVGSPFQVEEFKKKIAQTNLQKYGVDNPMKSEKFREKAKKTNLEKYGVEYPSQCQIVQDKMIETNIQKFGVKRPLQNPTIKEKARKTLQNNGTCSTSTQQIALYSMIKQRYPNAELNYPVGSCSLDVFLCIDGVNLDIEYDGWMWHQDQQRDIRRDKYLQSEGFKTLRIRSGHLLPTENELFSAIDYLVNTEHHFKEILLADWKDINEEVY